MGRFLGITGTPGTGKKTLAPRVAKALGLPCIGLNELVTERERTRTGAGVDPKILRHRLMNRVDSRCLVHGHLFPEVLEKRDVERVVVLRCNPAVLKRRLRSRGYSAAKLTSNVEAELIGLISSACASKFRRGRVAEFDTTSRKIFDSSKSVAGLLGARPPRGPPIDWLRTYSSAEKLRSLLSEARTESAFT